MMHTGRLTRLVGLSAFLLFGTAVQSDAALIDVTIGDPAEPTNGINGIPFNPSGFYPSTRYQQIYNRKLFSEPIQIQTVSFFGDPNDVSDVELFGTRVNPGKYEIRFSTTGKAMDGLSLTDFDGNVGSNESLFFTGQLGGSVAPGALLSITGSDFLYDPSDGNLLLDMRVTDRFSVGRGGFLSLKSGEAVSRAHDFGVAGFVGFGLVTRFAGESVDQEPTTSPVPEPSSIYLVGSGLLGLAGWRRRKMRSR